MTKYYQAGNYFEDFAHLFDDYDLNYEILGLDHIYSLGFHIEGSLHEHS